MRLFVHHFFLLIADSNEVMGMPKTSPTLHQTCLNSHHWKVLTRKFIQIDWQNCCAAATLPTGVTSHATSKNLSPPKDRKNSPTGKAFPVGLFFLSLGGDRFLDVAWEVTPVGNVAAAQQFCQSICINFLVKTFQWWEFKHVWWSVGEVLGIPITSFESAMSRKKWWTKSLTMRFH